jgi:hypothetical protein
MLITGPKCHYGLCNVHAKFSLIRRAQLINAFQMSSISVKEKSSPEWKPETALADFRFFDINSPLTLLKAIKEKLQPKIENLINFMEKLLRSNHLESQNAFSAHPHLLFWSFIFQLQHNTSLS